MKKTFLLFLGSMFFIACSSELDVENINEPNREEVLRGADGVRALASGLFNTWFIQEQHNFGSPGPAMWVMADWGTVTWANYGTLDMSMEPRVFLDNSPSYAYHSVINNYWRYMYSVTTTANDVVLAIQNGLEIGENGSETAMVKGFSHFMQGLGNGYIGLVYDKTFPSDENTDYETLLVTDYAASINLAIEQLEKSIEIFDNNDFVLPEDWINGNAFTSGDMSKLAHSFIARLMVYSARNKEQTEAIDWLSVLEHTNKGITEDFNVEGDGNGSDRKWMSWYKYYLARPNWGKVDMRVVNLLDESIPANWPDGGVNDLPHEGKIISNDKRILTDFEYDASNNRPERGMYRWSTYRYSRLDDYINANFFAPVILMRKAEIDMLKAEALLKLNRLSEAADIINSSTRVTRGNLPEVLVNENDISKAITYERTIELALTGMGIEYFDMRRNGNLQDGSLLHFPMPAQQLEVIQESFYTFGGIAPQFGTPNEDVSVNGWYKP
ncbi:RagB/SusD family nutrient uptake outer membrane protein [Polaribacter vadi]|uniref:RagB/SusD family nutrient uptake outer membrane protein n=1 Tax=Polaribacter TaxID=52959 RepID=UPI001C087CFA|nr:MULTISPECIES: RagB/SusD family nutrient uptake outer membrane protein [Polaribacter]MBU3012853.1 RagB/SusD family nutrient uptake outer membrane protein [Polaribacter vadi]MDO6742669.1 RagB/SusD family nutrient uptake outer membrane protein [Polaribacter sp. 1_MG-2023]